MRETMITTADVALKGEGKCTQLPLENSFKVLLFLDPYERCHCFVLQPPSFAAFCSYVVLLLSQISWSDYFSQRGEEGSTLQWHHGRCSSSGQTGFCVSEYLVNEKHLHLVKIIVGKKSYFISIFMTPYFFSFT